MISKISLFNYKFIFIIKFYSSRYGADKANSKEILCPKSSPKAISGTEDSSKICPSSWHGRQRNSLSYDSLIILTLITLRFHKHPTILPKI